ncbi:heat shock 70 kDa protein 12B-like [Mya arenaria]|uniref:heat shock 70 kDa protein 12B-like n=1 Tax=Mya arenaria TaxID=6604 RepID=UPI0022E40376|nr:heat shock 70 kDa protein 12B-like [Mya arenaria]
MAAKTQSCLIVAAFDVGTTYSGYAFSYRDDPLKVQTNQVWFSEGAGNFLSLKTPTSVLLNPDGKFDSFGFEAEDRYTNKAEDDKHHGWRLFRRFKMALHNDQQLSRHTTVDDIEGNPHKALPIFSMAIKFLQTHLLQVMSVEEKDISYVITVPAIWDDDAKEFMKTAATEAGLDETRVTLAPEPEAASIWCETLDVDTKAALAETGNQYMVIDLEDGTADISFRERKGIGTLKEIHQPTSGPWGGIYVDANYLKFLENIFGEQTITSLKNDEMDYFDFIRDFKTKKRTFSKHAKGKIIFRISANTRDLSKKFTGQNLEQRICSLGYGDSVIVRGGDKLGVEHDIVRTWFDGPIDSLIGHIKSFLKKRKLRAVQTIVLVGGFGGSPYVQDRLRAAFPDKRLILPVEAELAVLKGAVIFGYNPLVVVEKEKTYSTVLVAAFDFGTTYSGYAFSFINDPLKVQTNQTWYSGGAGKLISLKTPTSVLLNPEGEFDSFGFQAEDSYASKAEDDEHEGWRLFRRFKMVLHNNKELSRATTVEDIEGNSHQALPIFSMAIKFLQTHLLQAVENQTDGVLEREISYVITVPAIWDDNAKEFMRMAVEEAGLDGTRVTLALEPEAASIWCDTLDVDTIAALAGTGTQYMVIDLGGGTADISIQEKKQGGTLKEIHQPSGGPWGGIYVDANYLKFLDHIFGEKAITALKTEDMTDYFDVIREFETKKRTFTTQTKGKFMFKISATTRKLSEKFTGQNLEQRLRRLGYGDSVIVKCGDKLRVEPDIVRTWFDGPLNNLVDHVNNLLREAKLRAVQTIVLVGGFGESTYVQERLRAAIPDKRLIVPAEAGLVVLKGAVRFGHNPAIITSRVMKYTYGVAVWSPYDEKIHSADKKILDEDGKWRVRQCFSVFVRVNDNVPIDHQITKEYTPSGYRTATPIYRTTAEKPVYVTDPGCELLGELVTELPRDIPLSELRDDTTFMFGGTELVVKVRVKKTGQEEIIKLNCLK